MNEELFVYGTLRLPEVQLRVIGRSVELTSDILNGYKTVPVVIGGNEYLTLIQDDNSKIEGAVISVTKEELERIDAYEPEEYERISLTLESGKSVWVYAASDCSKGC